MCENHRGKHGPSLYRKCQALFGTPLPRRETVLQKRAWEGGSPWAFGRASLGSHRASADFIFSCLKCATASAPPPTTGRQMLTGQRSLVPDGRGAAALQGRRRVQALRVCVVSLAHTGAACTARDKRGPHSSRPHAAQGKRGGPCTPALGCCFVPKKWQYFLFSFAYTPRMN